MCDFQIACWCHPAFGLRLPPLPHWTTITRVLVFIPPLFSFLNFLTLYKHLRKPGAIKHLLGKLAEVHLSTCPQNLRPAWIASACNRQIKAGLAKRNFTTTVEKSKCFLWWWHSPCRVGRRGFSPCKLMLKKHPSNSKREKSKSFLFF